MIDFNSYVVGFVDGEGCFSIGINNQPEMKLGVQIQAEFAVSQSESSKDLLATNQAAFSMRLDPVQFQKR